MRIRFREVKEVREDKQERNLPIFPDSDRPGQELPRVEELSKQLHDLLFADDADRPEEEELPSLLS